MRLPDSDSMVDLVAFCAGGVPAARARRLKAPAARLARNLRVDFSVWDHRQRGECKV